MADLYKRSNVSLGQHFQTQTAISEESVQDFPLKPNQKNDIPPELMSSHKPKTHPSNYQSSSNDKEHPSKIYDSHVTQSQEKTPQYKQESNYTVLSPSLSTKQVKNYERQAPGKVAATTRLAEKRTSINNYNKRIVELNNHGSRINTKQINSITSALMPQSMKGVRDKKLGLEFSELHANHQDQRKALCSTRTSKPQLTSNNTTLKQEVPRSLLSQNVSPRKMVSPIQSLSALNKNIPQKGGNKMMIKKQMTEASLLQLNKSEQQLLAGHNNHSNDYQTITNQYRVGSPDTSKLLKNFKSNQNSISKQPTLVSQRSEQLIRNLSQEGKKQLVSKPIEVLHSQRAMAFDQKRGSVRYYSPTAQLSSLNKALQRISSVGELQRMKNQIVQKQRTSIQKMPAGRMSTMKAAQFILSQSKSKQDDDDEAMELTEDDDEYMTNQEKLWNAIESGQEIKVIRELLRKRDVDVNGKNIFDDGWTALHYAVHEGLIEVVKILVQDHRAAIDPRSATNKTPFHLACIRGEEDLVNFLLEHGANPQAVDREGCTPLHYLCETQNYEMVRKLLPVCAASKDVRNRFGKKPADLVRDAEVKRMLRAFSTKRNSRVSSQSRERSAHKATVQVTSLKDDKEVFDSIEQMFRKFSQFKKRSDSKKALERRQSSAQLTRPSTGSRRETLPSSRMTIAHKPTHTQAPTANKKNSNVKQMFQQQSLSTLKKNISPRPQKALAQSQSQRHLLQVTDKTVQLRNKIDQVLENIGSKPTSHCKDIIEEDYQDDDYQVLSDGKKVYLDKAEENSSQRTGESSHLTIEPNNVMRNKTTAFSLLNRLSDVTQPEVQVEEKVGPQSFVAHQLLGTGSFGEVFLVEKVSSGRFYAMKVLSKAKIMGHNLTRYAQTERNVMSVVDHPFVVRLNFAFQTQEKLFLILDYCPGGDLAEYLQLEKRFNEDKARLYSGEILLALEELHRKDIIFRDLKPDNVVLDAEGHAVLTDFGLSKEGVMREGMAKSFCGSYAYLAPEMLKKVGHGKAVDWYLLGVIIYEMLCGVPPYYANNKEELFENIKNAPLDLPGYLSPVAKDIIVRLLNRNSKKRLGTYGGADEIKKHPFFRAIDWKKLYNRQYKAPDPYLKKRFENFLQMSPEQQTNTEVFEQLRQQAALKGAYNLELHVPGWSFVSPQKE